MQDEQIERARQISRAHAKDLMAKANVVGVGVGQAKSGEIALVVMLSRKLPRTQLADSDIVPGELEGIPIELRVVGEIEAQSEELSSQGE